MLDLWLHLMLHLWLYLMLHLGLDLRLHFRYCMILYNTYENTYIVACITHFCMCLFHQTIQD